MRKRIGILFLAYYFPPDASSGTFRPFYFSRHLAELGIDVTILTARAEDFLPSQAVDFSLVSRIHPEVDVVRTRVRRPREALLSIKHQQSKGGGRRVVDGFSSFRTSSSIHPGPRFYRRLKDMVTDLLATPDPQMGWIPGAVNAGASLIREKDIHVICATGSPWSAMIAGALLRRMTDKPLLIDFRDPWVSNPAFKRRSALAQKIDTRLERIVVEQADALVANTEELRRDFLSRFSFLSRRLVQVVYNGFETYLCDQAPKNEAFSMVHAGSLYFSRSPAPLLEALRRLIASGKIPPEKLQVLLLGECETEDRNFHDLVKMLSMIKVLKISPRLPYAEAIQYQMNADLLLVIQPDFPLQIPRKVFEYMALKRPVLAISDHNGATAGMVRSLRLGNVAPNKPKAIEEAVLQLYRAWESSGTHLLPECLTAGFQNSVQAERFAAVIFDLVSDSAKKGKLRSV